MLKFRLYFPVYFIALLCILLLSLCFGFIYTPLTLLQLRRTIIAHDISNIDHTLIVSHTLFWIYLEEFQG